MSLLPLTESRGLICLVIPAFFAVESIFCMIIIGEFWAASNALLPYCGPGEISVGTAINIEHRAPTGIGAHVKAEAVRIREWPLLYFSCHRA
jgi:hypothetical protein